MRQSFNQPECYLCLIKFTLITNSDPHRGFVATAFPPAGGKPGRVGSPHAIRLYFITASIRGQTALLCPYMACMHCVRLNAELKFRERAQNQATECLATAEKINDPALYLRLRSKLSDANMEYALAQLALENHQNNFHG
jgi:hypothetical protein